jgi:ribonuclease BN (tRNA processing enzyme)
MTDIPVLYYNLLIKNKGNLFNGKIDVYMPGSPRGIASIIEGFEFFNVHILSEGTCFSVNGCNFSFKRMTHPVECYAVKAEFNDRKFVYSGDTTLNDELPVFAYGCDFLLADAAFLDYQLKENSPDMSSAQCASIAKNAEAGFLALTHQNPNTQTNDYEKEAREIFPNSFAVKIMEKMEI